MSILTCEKCSLRKSRTQVVLAHGDDNPDILFVGEAPGEDEDREGIPFIGRSGQLLRSIVHEVGLGAYRILYDNVLKCRPPDNKRPEPGHVAACYDHLEMSIVDYKPKVIVPLGGPALKRILRTPDITQRQGKVFWSMAYNTWVVPQFHPAYILRQLTKRTQYAKNFKTIMDVVEDPDREWAPRVTWEDLDYTLVESSGQLRDLWKSEIQHAEYMTFDTEARLHIPGVVHPFHADLLGVSLCWEEGRAAYMPFFNTDIEVQSEISWPESTINFLRMILESDIPKGAHNTNFDSILLHRTLGIQVENVVDDTMVAGHCLDPDISKALQKWSCVVGMSGYDWGIDPWTRGKKKEEIDYSIVPLEILGEYCCGDSDCAFRLAQLLNEITPQEQRDVYYSISMPMVETVRGMEERGALVDREGAKKLDDYYVAQLEDIQIELDVILQKFHPSPDGFNWNSGPQVKNLLFEYIGLPVVARSAKTKQPSFNAKVKKKLKGEHPVVDFLAERDRLSKALSTFVRPLSGQMLDENDRVHTIYKVSGTRTGRLSSASMNLQNITGPTDEHPVPRIRNLFMAPPEGTLAALDVDRAEVAVLGMYCKDPNLCQALRDRVDVHLRMASQVYGKPEDEISKNLRTRTKRVTFGIMYGQTSVGLAEELNIEEGEAKEIMRAYFAQFPTIEGWMADELKKARRLGYVQNVFGRRRYLRNLYSPNDREREADERKVVNTLIQGTTSEIISIGTVDLGAELKRQRQELMAWLIMTIHDAVIVECLRKDRVREVEMLMCSCMLGVGERWDLDVCLSGDVKFGRRWGDMDVGIVDGSLSEVAA